MRKTIGRIRYGGWSKGSGDISIGVLYSYLNKVSGNVRQAGFSSGQSMGTESMGKKLCWHVTSHIE